MATSESPCIFQGWKVTCCPTKSSEFMGIFWVFCGAYPALGLSSKGRGGKHVSGRDKGRMVSLMKYSGEGDLGLGDLPFNHRYPVQGEVALVIS